MHLIDKIYVENHYAASAWNFEKTTKYVFEENAHLIEASFFEHYHDDCFVKKVVELPSSYGCPMKCRFCASSNISNIFVLSAETIVQIYLFILSDNNLKPGEEHVVSFTGMGDYFFTSDMLEKAMLEIKSKNNVTFTVSSCCWTGSMLKNLERISNQITFRAVQFSYISHKVNIVNKIIPFYCGIPFHISQWAQMIKDSSVDKFRINYIMIKGINDSPADFDEFVSLFVGVKEKIVVRIAKLNPTAASERNGLFPPNIDCMNELQTRLNKFGFNSYLFYSAQNDNMNCGQLITERNWG